MSCTKLLTIDFLVVSYSPESSRLNHFRQVDILSVWTMRRTFTRAPSLRNTAASWSSIWKMLSTCCKYITTRSKDACSHSYPLTHSYPFVDRVFFLQSGPDLEPFLEILSEVGATHLQHGVSAEHFSHLKDALLYFLETSLGEEWNSELKLQWETVYGLVSFALQEGIRRKNSSG